MENRRLPIKNQIEARKLLMKSKIYRIVASVFACLGLILFAYLHVANSRDGFWESMRDPTLVVLLLFSFFPAIILSLVARKVETKLNSYFTED
jgi:hypothetical protein